MFETQVGALQDGSSTAYLRPETAQGIFINFKNVAQLARRKPPFGIAQVGGKTFRNEITPGNFLFRLREFEQMEMEFFVPPAEATSGTATGSTRAATGTSTSASARRTSASASTTPRSDPTTRAAPATSITSTPSAGRSSRESRTAATTTSRSTRRRSGTKLEWVEQDGTRYTPHVIEPAVSIDRIMLAFLCDAYDEEVVGDRERVVLRLHPLVAPVKAAILPLIAKDEGMATRARALYEELRRFHVVEHDEGGQIGRRYRRQDEIGTPWAFTVDEQTLEDETVTVRDRDSLAQERLPISGVRAWLDDALARDWRSPQSR